MPLRILVVDDSEVFRRCLRPMLESNRDWEICGEAVDGAEGVEKHRLLVPDLVLMDFSMPRMTGLESATAILKEFPKVPIVLLTLYLTKQLAQAARNVGIRATISKANMNCLANDIAQVCTVLRFEARLLLIRTFCDVKTFYPGSSFTAFLSRWVATI